ncbi:MAG: T9SS type A sorting domain-containing protein [Bacteroidales bacterium]|nr:T9SS type A sorting domain-containing protein [Bacteroidales bacterium]
MKVENYFKSIRYALLVALALTNFALFAISSSFTCSILKQNKNGLEILFKFDPMANSNQPFSGYIALPQQAIAELEIVNRECEDYEGTYPEFPITSQVASLSGPVSLRSIDAVILHVFPVYRDKESGGLKRVSEIVIKINFIGGEDQFGDDRLRSVWWEPLLSNLLINYESLPAVGLKNISGKETGAEYLVISPNAEVFKQWADTIRVFRNQQGILTKVVTLDEIGGNTAAQIEAYIDEAYNNWDIPPVAVLLLGDEGSDPAYTIPAPVWDNYCISDNVYADVDGDDLPDIMVARMSAENATHLENIIGKVKNFELNPPSAGSFYEHPITSCFFQTGGIAQILTESVAGFYEVILGKSTNRINVAPSPLPAAWTTSPEGLALAAYFIELGYLPATPAGVNTGWNGTAQDFVDGINNGAFMLLFDGLASVGGWLTPTFTVSDLPDLTNPDPVFVWSIAAFTGQFDAPVNCFAEEIHRHPYGALGVLAASKVTYTQPSDIFAMGAMDQLWDDYLPEFGTSAPNTGIYPAFAHAAGKYYLQQSPWPENPNIKAATYHLFHYFGDAFSTLYTEVPQVPEVEYEPFVPAWATSFDVTANEGSLIALSVDGELIGAAFGTGSSVGVPMIPQIPPAHVLVTVTQRNFQRYRALLPVVYLEGIPETGAGLFEVFPNPSDGVVFIDYKGNRPTNLKITVTDLSGKVVYKSEKFVGGMERIAIHLEGVEKGLYLMGVMIGNEKNVSKIAIP